jgi:hypothetical protein
MSRQELGRGSTSGPRAGAARARAPGLARLLAASLLAGVRRSADTGPWCDGRPEGNPGRGARAAASRMYTSGSRRGRAASDASIASPYALFFPSPARLAHWWVGMDSIEDSHIRALAKFLDSVQAMLALPRCCSAAA